jgi:hypothetical protein
MWGSTGSSRQPDATFPPMTLVRPTAPAQAAPDPGATPAPAVSRSIVSEVPVPTVQTSPLSVGMVQGPTFGPTATPVIQRIDGSPPPAAEPKSGGSDRSDDELDELARSLFGRIRGHLRNEYIYEREAKGLTFDQS